jgi:GNAT superfamily N-acetyltransferase
MKIDRVVPLTADTWADLEDLFGPNGACVGCWCMWWRTTKQTYKAGRASRDTLRALADAEVPVGLLAYAGIEADGGQRAVGWCAVAPRASYPRLASTAVGRGGRDAPSRWAVPCFFVRPGFRRHGFTDTLLDAALAHSRRYGATVVEGYPLTAKAGPSELYVGTKQLFGRHGFTVVREPTSRRAVMERTFSAEA